jgi:hypothetical protein
LAQFNSIAPQSVGLIGNKSVMDFPLVRMALERGGGFCVRFEDWGNGTSNLEQMKCAKEINNAVGRPVVTGAEAIKYLDIPFAEMRPNDSVDRSVASFREIVIREPVQTLTSS